MRPEERALTARFALSGYEVAADELLTPALLIYPAALDNNIAATIKLLGGRPERWRPHVKTAKLAWVMQRLLDHGIRRSAARCGISGYWQPALPAAAPRLPDRKPLQRRRPRRKRPGQRHRNCDGARP